MCGTVKNESARTYSVRDYHKNTCFVQVVISISCIKTIRSTEDTVQSLCPNLSDPFATVAWQEGMTQPQ
jgi:hypothetical protein